MDRSLLSIHFIGVNTYNHGTSGTIWFKEDPEWPGELELKPLVIKSFESALFTSNEDEGEGSAMSFIDKEEFDGDMCNPKLLTEPPRPNRFEALLWDKRGVGGVEGTVVSRFVADEPG